MIIAQEGVDKFKEDSFEIIIVDTRYRRTVGGREGGRERGRRREGEMGGGREGGREGGDEKEGGREGERGGGRERGEEGGRERREVKEGGREGGRGGEGGKEGKSEGERGSEGGVRMKWFCLCSLFSGRHKQEESLFEEMLQVSQAIVSGLTKNVHWNPSIQAPLK